MTHLEAQAIINNIVYKNYRITFRPETVYEEVGLILTAPVKDACSGYAYSVAPEVHIKTYQTYDIDYFNEMTKDQFIGEIFDMCKRLELHELKEHFKVDGVCLYDPHPENKLTIDKPNQL